MVRSLGPRTLLPDCTVERGAPRGASPQSASLDGCHVLSRVRTPRSGSARRTLTTDDRTGVATAVMNCCFESAPTPQGAKGPTHASTGENLLLALSWQFRSKLRNSPTPRRSRRRSAGGWRHDRPDSSHMQLH